MAARRSPRTAWRGRSILLLALFAFVTTSVIVVWRRSRGVAEEKLIAELDGRLRDLQAQQTQLERDLRDAMSSARIKPAAERRLGLRMATDSQLITLPHRVPQTAATDSL